MVPEKRKTFTYVVFRLGSKGVLCACRGGCGCDDWFGSVSYVAMVSSGSEICVGIGN